LTELDTVVRQNRHRVHVAHELAVRLHRIELRMSKGRHVKRQTIILELEKQLT
jgi:hypothetical protein